MATEKAREQRRVDIERELEVISDLSIESDYREAAAVCGIIYALMDISLAIQGASEELSAMRSGLNDLRREIRWK